MLRVAALDDEPHVLERFEEVVKEFDDIQLCGLFDDDDDLMAYVRENSLDVAFLDIEMPGKTGLQLAEELQTADPEISVVFVTAHTQYAVDAFELSVVDYIVKPISKERLQKTLNRINKINKNLKPKSVIEKKIEIDCFPRFECKVDGNVLAFNHLMKAKELLAFLVSRKGAETSWEQITEALWPEMDYEKAHNNLYATTFRLRKWLSENQINQIFECKRNSYRVIPAEFDCDFFEMEDAWKEDDLKKMQLLYKGDFLEEDGYEWAYAVQAEWAQRMNG